MYCPNCGKPVNDDSKFCPYCGAPLKTTQTEVSTDNGGESSEDNLNVEGVDKSVILEEQQQSQRSDGQPQTDFSDQDGIPNGAATPNSSITEEASYTQTNDNDKTQNNAASSTESADGGSKLGSIVNGMNKGLDGLGYFGLGVLILLVGIYMVISGHWITVAAIIVFLLVFYRLIKINNDRTRLIVLAVCVVVGVFAWFGTGTNKYVSEIQDSTIRAFSSKTVGKAFDDFFSNPKWKYDGKNADGDPVVIFSGKCKYQGETVTATIEFTLGDRGYNSNASITSLKFNNIEQPDFMITVLLNEVFE